MILESTRGALAVAAKPRDPWGAYSSLPMDSFAGQSVTPESALALTAVYGAVALVAETNGTMPLEVIDTRAASGQRVVSGGYLAPMLQHAPNEDQSGVDLWMMVFAHLMLRGNAYLAKLRNQRGVVNELVPILPQHVHPYRNDDGRKVFRVQLYSGSTFIEQDFTDDAILHIKGKSISDLLVGESAIAHVRNTIGTQLAQSEYQARSYGDGMLIKGVLSTPERNLNPEAVQRVKAQWKSAYAGVGASHEIAVLHSGIQFQQVSMSPEDAQFIQTMKWGHTQVATAFKIPASRLNGEGTSLTYANQGQDDLFYDKQACLPLRIMVEACLNRDRDLFGAQSVWVPKFNSDIALRADVKTRFEVYKIERELGTRSQNDILRAEDRPTIGPDGDDYTPLGNRSAPPATPAVGSERVVQRNSEHAPQPVTVHVGSPIVNVPPADAPEVRVDAPIVNVAAAPVPEVRVEAPKPANVVVNVPEQPAPIVNVAPADVHVDVAAPAVTVEAPTVYVEPSLTTNEQPRTLKVKRDANGFITGATIDPTKN